MIADPFPHTISDYAWDLDFLRCTREEFDLIPAAAWQQFRNPREHKNAITFEQARTLGAEHCWSIRKYLADPGTIGRLEDVTGIAGLEFDELGGGLHEIPVGGHLAVHVDFNRDDHDRHRRVNLLLYLNEGWKPEWGGQLELWGKNPVVVQPEMGAEVIFVCSETSWHGHPRPVTGPFPRRSLAAYYFTRNPPPDEAEPHSTIFLEDTDALRS